jgi:hypothetical protein
MPIRPEHGTIDLTDYQERTGIKKPLRRIKRPL